MAKINVLCPHCRKAYRIDEANLGKKARCTQCSRGFVLGSASQRNIARLVAALGNDLELDAVSRRLLDERAIKHAVSALYRIGEPAADLLVQAMRRTTFAHLALGLIGTETAFRALLRELECSDWRRVVAAAKALGRMADPRALKPLGSLARSRAPEIREAVTAAVANIDQTRREITEGRWFMVDTENPYEQVVRMRSRYNYIVHDPDLRERALRWHHDFVATMPRMRFDSDHERAETWHRLGNLAFDLIHPGKKLVFVKGRLAVDCPEAAYCFEQSRSAMPRDEPTPSAGKA